jgi:hypothetical protein
MEVGCDASLAFAALDSASASVPASSGVLAVVATGVNGMEVGCDASLAFAALDSASASVPASSGALAVVATGADGMEVRGDAGGDAWHAFAASASASPAGCVAAAALASGKVSVCSVDSAAAGMLGDAVAL